MRRFGWLFGLASLVVLGGVDRAQGSPLTLAFSGNAYATRISPDPATMDVTNGFSGFYEWGTQSLIGQGMGGSPMAVESSIDVTATLSDADRILATVQFSAPVTGTITWDTNQIPRGNTARGSAVGVVTLAPGVDPSLIPSWLTGMTATVTSSVAGGSGLDGLPHAWSGLTISADPAPVPEPSSVLVFLAAAGFVGLRRLRHA